MVTTQEAGAEREGRYPMRERLHRAEGADVLGVEGAHAGSGAGGSPESAPAAQL